MSDNRCEEVHQDLKIRLVDFFRKNSVLCFYIFRSASEAVCEILGSVMDNKTGKVFSSLIILFNIIYRGGTWGLKTSPLRHTWSTTWARSTNLTLLWTGCSTSSRKTSFSRKMTLEPLSRETFATKFLEPRSTPTDKTNGNKTGFLTVSGSETFKFSTFSTYKNVTFFCDSITVFLFLLVCLPLKCLYLYFLCVPLN